MVYAEQETNYLEFLGALLQGQQELLVLLLVKGLCMVDLLNLSLQYLHASQVA